MSNPFGPSSRRRQQGCAYANAPHTLPPIRKNRAGLLVIPLGLSRFGETFEVSVAREKKDGNGIKPCVRLFSFRWNRTSGDTTLTLSPWVTRASCSREPDSLIANVSPLSHYLTTLHSQNTITRHYSCSGSRLLSIWRCLWPPTAPDRKHKNSKAGLLNPLFATLHPIQYPLFSMFYL